MLEVRDYSKAELSAILRTRNKPQIDNKLKNYDIEFYSTGSGNNRTYHITQLNDPFKVFAILELGFEAQTDFRKLRNFYYYFFNDEEFSAMPDEVKEQRMRSAGMGVSRQTIASYLRKLDATEMINRNSYNYIYYFAFKGTQRMTDKTEYSKAWSEYWSDLANKRYSPFGAIEKMRENYGGVAKKQAIPETNVFYKDKLQEMLTCLYQSIENELSNGTFNSKV